MMARTFQLGDEQRPPEQKQISKIAGSGSAAHAPKAENPAAEKPVALALKIEYRQ